MRTRIRRSLWLFPIATAAFAVSAWVSAATPPDALHAAIEEQRGRAAERPTDPALRSDLGNLLALAGEDQEAEAAYEEALRLDPALFDAHYNLGVLLLAQRRFESAFDHLRQARMLDPGSAWARYQLGTALRELGRREDAIRAYAEAFRLEPRLAFADVNPDVIHNALLTESLLRAHRGRSASEGTPRVYSEPARIASMLLPLPSPPAPTVAPATGDATETPATAAAAPGTSTAFSAPTLQGGDEAPDEESIESERSTDDRQLRLVTPTAPDENPSARSEPRAPAGQVFVAPVPARRRVGPDDLTGSGELNQAQPPEATTPGGRPGPVTRFRPGRRSSAQLDLLLLPRNAGEGPRKAESTAKPGRR